MGTATYPWGDYFPPHWDDGNYAILADGREDPNKVGMDGIFGTAPVSSFKPNNLGFYDLGGNAIEWMLGGVDWMGHRVFRGGRWSSDAKGALSANRGVDVPTDKRYKNSQGFRVALGRLQSGEAGSR